MEIEITFNSAEDPPIQHQSPKVSRSLEFYCLNYYQSLSLMLILAKIMKGKNPKKTGINFFLFITL